MHKHRFFANIEIGDEGMVLNRKRLIFVLFLLLILCFLLMYKDNQYAEEKLNQTIQTNGTPVSSHTIIIDAGHGEPDGGAVSENGISEAEINLSITLKLQKLLEQSGCNVILTRSDENGIYDLDEESIRNKKVSDIKNRVEIAKTAEADCFISIHLNKIPQSQYSGWQTFYQSSKEDSKELAYDIQNNLNYTIQKENKREILPLSGKYIMDNVNIPTVTVECGFLSNPEEERMLQEEDYQEKLAWGIFTGIMDYFYN